MLNWPRARPNARIVAGALKTGLDERIHFFDLRVQGQHALRDPGQHGSGQLLARQRDVLGIGRSDSSFGERRGVLDATVLQPGLKATDANPADRSWRLIAGCVLNMDRSW
ncbi:hypothetical protein ACWC0C_45325 [Streptomyces sp. NPDC001709]